MLQHLSRYHPHGGDAVYPFPTFTSKWKWRVDEVFEKVTITRFYYHRAVDYEGEVPEAVVTKRWNKASVLKFLKKLMKRHGCGEEIVTDRFASHTTALRELGALEKHRTGRWLNNRVENSDRPFRGRERAMQGLRPMRSLQKFAAVRSVVYNPFKQERSLLGRDTFKLTRTAKLHSGVSFVPDYFTVSTAI